MKRIGDKAMTPTERAKRSRDRAMYERSMMIRTIIAINSAGSMKDVRMLCHSVISTIGGGRLVEYDP